MKLSVIIVNYNVKYFLEQAIQSALKASQNFDTEIIVVDNNSVDGSVDMVQTKFTGIHIIANKKNTGFSAANNQGIAVATGEYILLLNPDTVVEEDTFKKCIEFMDMHADAGGLGVKMIDGKGTYLPESKRAFPSPEVAFYKAFGLATLFPKSKIFGKYHLGYLDENKIHEVDVLAGAFMLIRKTVLDKIGCLDETFFMYGEDIDLSYRIVKAGYKNYYFPETTIIHYKGESTKKGSMNYVRMFYNAMKIFAKKHFSGSRAGVLVALLNFAIYVRAFIAVFIRIAKKIALPLLDALIIFAGMYLIKEYWEYYIKFIEGGEYPKTYLFINMPIYIFIWIISIFFSGGYDKNANALKIIRGIFWGTIVISAVYGFLPETLRFSRGMIVAGAAFTVFALFFERILLHAIQYKNLRFGRQPEKKILIIGNTTEANRVIQLLNQLNLSKNILGFICTTAQKSSDAHELGNINQLKDLIEIYKADELIFCSKDISSRQIMDWMVRLGQSIDYKIVPDQSLSIIGSNSKNTAGDLYTVDIELKITIPSNKRNKLLIDIVVALYIIITFPLQFLFVKNMSGLFKNVCLVLTQKKSWVGYISQHQQHDTLPKIKTGVLNPLDGFSQKLLDENTLARLNMLYAKDYKPFDDIEIILKGYKNLGR